ncbi:MAG: RNase adapter RapZ [Oscillospiraceae bacterium]|nr:RNase adapter RapZ [Oscillospiraceae bacterium]
MEIIIISGLSGAGKSRVAGVLEDMDFYCVDNMPVVLMPKFAELCIATRGRYERVALVTDVRNIENFNELFSALEEMHDMGCEYTILFVEAATDTIVKRYKETRRRHPLDVDGIDLSGAVQREKELMEPVRRKASYIIDTSGLTLGMLQRRLVNIFMSGHEDQSMQITVESFGYKFGIPIEADLVFDVRFLPNPFYVPELKEKSGLDREVRDYIFGFDVSNKYMEKLCGLIEFLIPQYIEEGKSQLFICFGCTGGHHRSVAVAEKLGEMLASDGHRVELLNRDIGKS